MCEKDLLRARIKKLLENTNKEDFLSQGVRAAALLSSLQYWLETKSILIFISLANEINTNPIIKMALEQGKKVYIPRQENGKIRFYHYSSLDLPLVLGEYGIKEPHTGEIYSPQWQNGENALILTPGLAFGSKGERLGRGKGFYDKFFKELDAKGSKYTAVGLCMDFQLIENIPMEKHDKKMEAVLTGSEFI